MLRGIIGAYDASEKQATKRVIKAAALPKHPIPKSAVTTNMLAYIIVAKYCDALPLYRLEKILSRYGGSVTRTTMANWLIRLSVQLQPLINLMYDHQRTGVVINADETRVQVLKEPSKSIHSDKYMWVTLGGPPGQTAVLFDYDPSRSKVVPLRLFEGFKGYLQTDGYASYNAVCLQEGITQLGCFDHVRRKFTDAKKGEVKERGKKKQKNPRVSKSDVALGKIRKLYAVEDKIKGLTVDEKKHQRQVQSLPLLNDLHEWLEKNVSRVVPDSLVHTGIQYALNQWPKLTVYCEDGHLSISNAAARECHSSLHDREAQLAVCRYAKRGKSQCRLLQFDRKCQSQRPGTVCLSEACPQGTAVRRDRRGTGKPVALGSEGFWGVLKKRVVRIILCYVE